MIRYLSERIANYIVTHDDDPDNDVEVLSYGYELLLQGAAVLGTAMLIALFLGIVPLVAVAYAAYSLIRSMSGGLHAKYRIACIGMSVVLLFVPALLSDRLELGITATGAAVLYVVNTAILGLYAPADTKENPIRNKARKKQLKAFAMGAVTLLFAAALLIRNRYPALAFVLVVNSTIACCTTHPWAYRLFGCEKS